jgi:hypothetical protein
MNFAHIASSAAKDWPSIPNPIRYPEIPFNDALIVSRFRNPLEIVDRNGERTYTPNLVFSMGPSEKGAGKS